MMALTLTPMASWLYARVTGWQAPVIRSAAGLTLFLIGSYFYRQRRILNLLAAVAIALILVDPAATVRAQLPAFVPGGGIPGRAGGPSHRQDFRTPAPGPGTLERD